MYIQYCILPNLIWELKIKIQQIVIILILNFRKLTFIRLYQIFQHTVYINTSTNKLQVKNRTINWKKCEHKGEACNMLADNLII